MRLSFSPQLEESPSAEFERLKSNLFEISGKKGSLKKTTEATKQLDTFLSHVHIEKANDEMHNTIPYLRCSYDEVPLTIPAIIKNGTESDTIQFQDGKWYISKELSPEMEISLLCFSDVSGTINKQSQKAIKSLNKKHARALGPELCNKNGSLFFVKEEDLYYAAIGSKKIPTFPILSNSKILNYASCLKVILKASGIEASYEEIISDYLDTTIDEPFAPLKDRNKMIAGRKIETTIIHDPEAEASFIVNELVKERFLIAIDKNGNIGLLTAIALKGEEDYLPVSVRLRVPSLTEDNAKVQMSWNDFCKRTTDLVKVDIY